MKVGLVLLWISLVAVNCIDVKDYLQRFGYYNPNSYDQSNLENALKTFQRTYKLPVTGILDEPTKKLMNTPRCGNPDHQTSPNAFADTAWRKKFLTYYFYNYSQRSRLSKADIRRITVQAFKFWSDHTPLQFQERRGGDIVFGFGSRSHRDDKKSCGFPFDGRSRVLAHAFFPPDGRLHYDDDEEWTDGTSRGSNFLSTAVHEIGHILGLEHDSSSKQSIMYPYDQGYVPNLRLHANDIRRIQRLYGTKTGGTGPTAYPTNAPPATRPPPPGCRDKHINCWQHRHDCNRYPTHFRKYCARTCNFC